MKVSKVSILDGQEREMDLDITPEQLAEINDANGRLIQYVVPNLTSDEREFLITGMTPEQWDSVFAEE